MSLTPPEEWDDIPFPDEPPDLEVGADSPQIVDAGASDSHNYPLDDDGPPGEPLTAPHIAYLLDQALTEDYLDQPHVTANLRSVTAYSQLPEHFRWAVEEECAGGILFGHPDPKTAEVVWQFRPDHPRSSEAKYVFPKGSGSPIALRSTPLTTAPVGHTVVIVEGTKQALAGASALAHDPLMVVVGIAGCHGGLTHGKLAPGIAHVIKGASRVVIVPDADASTNPDVYAAMHKLGKALRARLTKRRAVSFAQLHAAMGGSR